MKAMTKITLRNKTATKLSESLQIALLNAIVVLNSKDEAYALERLWTMTHNPNMALLEIRVATQSYAKSLKDKSKLDGIVIIPDELVPVWRNEMRYQYTMQHPNSFSVEVSEKIKDAFYALYNATDAVTSAVVYKHCKMHIERNPSETIDRALWLLNCSEENNFYGGIRSLHFHPTEALALKPFVKQIHALLSEMYAEYQENLEKATEPLSSPFAGLADQLAEKGIQLPDETPHDEDTIVNKPVVANSSVVKSDFKELSAANILADKEAFEAMPGSLMELYKLGYDLNKVINKHEAIINFLEAVKALEN